MLDKEEGIPFTREDNEQLRGVSRQKSLEILLAGCEYSDDKKKELMDKKNLY